MAGRGDAPVSRRFGRPNLLASLASLAFLAACSAARPGGVLYVDPRQYPYGVEGVSCGEKRWCPDGYTCGNPALPSCDAATECCPGGSAFGDTSLGKRRRVPVRTSE